MSPAEGHEPGDRRRAGHDRRRVLTLMSVDLVGSTPLAEQLDPELLRDVIVSYHDICDQAVARYGGVVGARQGDGLMAHFGIAEPHADDPQRATLAGLAILDALVPLSDRCREDAGVEVQVRIGVHTGPVVITELSGRRDIIGSTANETARVEAAAAPGTVAVSAATHALIADHFVFGEPVEMALKGVSAPMVLRPVLRPAPANTALSGVIPFVGRRRERERLTELFTAVSADPGPVSLSGVSPSAGTFDAGTLDAGTFCAGTFCAVLVSGGPGFGKSRLVNQMANLAARSGAGRVVMQARAYDSMEPYHPVIEALRHAFDIDRSAPPTNAWSHLCNGLDELGAIDTAPFLAQVMGLGQEHLGEAGSMDPLLMNNAIVTALLGWLRATAQRAPLVVIAEDVHWADPSTASLLARILAERPNRVLLLMTARSAAELPWTNGVETMELGPLSHDEVIRLAGLVERTVPLTDEQVGHLIDRCDGVPLYVDRLLQVARRRPSLLADAIPNDLDHLVSAVLEGPGVDQELVGLLATIGRQFDADFVAKATGETVDATIERLDELCRLGVLDPQPDARRPGYRFHHSLLQSAAYEHLLQSDRRTAHRVIARTIEAGGEHSFHVTSLARHYDLGGNVDAAVDLYLKGSLAAQHNGANAEALRLVERGLELLGTSGTSAASAADEGRARNGDDRDVHRTTSRVRSEIDLQLALANLLTGTEGFGSVRAHTATRRAQELAAELDDEALYLTVANQLFNYFTVRGMRADAAAVINDARARSWTVAGAHSAIDQMDALHSVALGRWVQAHDLYLALIEDFQRLERDGLRPVVHGPTDGLGAAYTQMIQISWHLGQADQTSEWMALALKRARSFEGARAAFGEAFATSWDCYVLRQRGNDAAALSRAQEMAQFCGRKGLLMWAGIAAVHETVAGARLAPTTATEAVLVQMAGMLDMMGVATMASYWLTELAVLQLRLGRPSESVSTSTRAIEVAERNVELQELPFTYCVRARARRELGDEIGAADDVMAAANLAREQGSVVYELRALIDAAELATVGSGLIDEADVRRRLVAAVDAVESPEHYADVPVARQLIAERSDDRS